MNQHNLIFFIALLSSSEKSSFNPMKEILPHLTLQGASLLKRICSLWKQFQKYLVMVPSIIGNLIFWALPKVIGTRTNYF